MPENFKEKLEERLRAGWTRTQIEKDWKYSSNSKQFDIHISHAFPGCRNITDVRAMLGLVSCQSPGPAFAAKTSVTMQRTWERTMEIAASFLPVFEKHTCIMPVGWRDLTDRGWNASADAKRLREACPECRAGRSLPYKDRDKEELLDVARHAKEKEERESQLPPNLAQRSNSPA
jgi:hypothetical protein